MNLLQKGKTVRTSSKTKLAITICSSVDMEKQKQEELSKESEEMTRLMEEMRLKDEEKKRWYVKKHSL